MRKLKSCFLAMLLTLFTTVGCATAPVNFYSNLPALINQTEPAIVSVFVLIRINDIKSSIPVFERAAGAGSIIDAKNGYILTNAHVVKDASKIAVELYNGHTYSARIVGVDAYTDLAVIQIKPGAETLTEIPLGDSSKVRVGDSVFVIGNPYELTETVTHGIISTINRHNPNTDHDMPFLQTDAPLNLGNSGGALINAQGQLIGIPTMLFSAAPDQNGNIGLGFCIPVNSAKPIILTLIAYGFVARPNQSPSA